MNRPIVVVMTTGLLTAAALAGQDNGDNAERRRVNTQAYFGQLAVNPSNRPIDEGFSNRVVAGRPFSATEERHFLQVLGDGTRIETRQTNQLYRDGQGRTRTEGEDGKATIFDPVAMSRAEIDPAAKTVRYLPYGGAVAVLLNQLNLVARTPAGLGNANGVRTETADGLGPQMVNGVPARGERTTQTIPAGEIGNNREIKIVTERWISEDLQMLIKSTNTDPRFGDTTYQLTGVAQREPDAALFQVPAGFTEVGGPGRSGGRGGARGGAPPATGGRGGRGQGKQ